MRNIFKRTLAIVIALTMVLCTAPLSEDSYLELPEWLSLKANAEGATEYTDGIFTYTVTDGEATITECAKYDFMMSKIEIPSVLGGHPVTAIGKLAFAENWSPAVVIPDSVTTIADYAFYNCQATELFIGKGVTTIGKLAIEGNCLENIYVSTENSIFSSEDGVLFNKDKSTLIKYPSDNTRRSYSLPDTVTTIAEHAFGDCYDLEEVTLDNNLEVVEDYAFYGYIADEEIIIPDSVISIGEKAFGNINVVVSEGNGTYSSEDGVLFNKYKTVLISYMKRNERTSYTLPNTVKIIADNAFEGAYRLSEIVFPESLINIGNSAFSDCDYLTEVVIPENVAYIGEAAFSGCDRLTKITVAANNKDYSSQDGVLFNKDKTLLIQYPVKSTDEQYSVPASVTEIADYAFENSNLKKITFNDSLKTIGAFAFAGCNDIYGEIVISNSVTEIGEKAFSYCMSLTKVSIGDGVKTIGENAFNSNASLENINVSENNAKYSSADGVLFNKDRTELIMCPCANERTLYTVPAGVVRINNSAFVNCTKLTEVILPDSISTIGIEAFEYCSNLQKINLTDNIKSIGESTFYDCSSLTDIELPSNLVSINANTFYGCESLNKVSIPDSVTTIGTSAFADCKNLASVTIGKNVTEIGFRAFDYCPLLTEVKLPDSVKIIGAYAFSACPFEKINIPEDIMSIGACAFAACEKLNNVVIPEGVKYIAGGTFSMCFGLSDVSIPDSVTSIGDYAFACCGLTEITISENVTRLGICAFAECSNLSKLTIYGDITEMGMDAFGACPNLTEVYIDDGVTVIGGEAFYACDSLKKINIPDSVTEIGAGAFYECLSLTEITIPNNVTNINDYTFRDCVSLESVTIPKSVTSIGESAFDECLSLTEITIPNNVTDIGDSAFIYCVSLESVTIPKSVTSIGESAFYECEKLADVYYSGTEEEWNKIAIEAENEPLLNATIHFNYPPVHVCEYTTFVRYEDAHPHYAVYKCECGAEQVSTEASYIASCTICNPVVTSIRVDSAPATTSYQYKADTSLDGLKVIAVYSDNSEVDVTDSVKVSGYDTLSTGDKTATVEFEGCIATFDYTVNYVWWQWIIRILLLGFLWY